VLDVERLAEAVALLRLDLGEHEDEQVGEGVVEDEVGTEGLRQLVDQREPVQSLEQQQLPRLLDLRESRGTLCLWLMSSSTAVSSTMPYSRNECR
jgi:hypothetical protein